MSEKQRHKRREGHLLRRYGITLAQYLELLESQGGGCYVCAKTEAEEGKALAVDHDHATGEVRGILCQYCNHRVVGRHRDADKMQRVADYLRGPFTGWFVPRKKKRRKKK